jgi:hypothetical protein
LIRRAYDSGRTTKTAGITNSIRHTQTPLSQTSCPHTAEHHSFTEENPAHSKDNYRENANYRVNHLLDKAGPHNPTRFQAGS